MLRSYRNIIAAIAGWVTLVGNTPDQQRVTAPSPSPEKQGASGTSQTQKDPSPLPVSIIETPEQAVASNSREAKSQQHDASDLNAQIRAADAAEDQIFPAWVAAFLSFVGTLLIIWTLYETRKANRISSREYARSRNEARKAYKLAADTAEGQLRPYLFVERVDALRTTLDLDCVDIVIKNFGNSPATKVWFTSAFQRCKFGEVVVPSSEQVWLTCRDIAPHHHQRLRAPIDVEDWRGSVDQIEKGNIVLVIRLKFRYQFAASKFDTGDHVFVIDLQGAREIRTGDNAKYS